MTAPLGYLDTAGRGQVRCRDCSDSWESHVPPRNTPEPEPVYEGDRYLPTWPLYVLPGQLCAGGCGRVLLEVCDE